MECKTSLILCLLISGVCLSGCLSLEQDSDQDVDNKVYIPRKLAGYNRTKKSTGSGANKFTKMLIYSSHSDAAIDKNIVSRYQTPYGNIMLYCSVFKKKKQAQDNISRIRSSLIGSPGFDVRKRDVDNGEIYVSLATTKTYVFWSHSRAAYWLEFPARVNATPISLAERINEATQR